MTILHVLNSPRAEGTVRLALDWLALSEPRQEVLLLQPEPADLTKELRARSAWLGTGSELPAGPRKFWWIARRVAHVCRARQITLVVCWINGFSPWVLAGARAAGVRLLLAHAGNPPTRTVRGRLQTTFSTMVAWALGGRLVCCSRYVADHYARSFGVPRSVLRVVYNCAPVERIRDAATAARWQRRDWRPRLIMVATLEAHKDHATLLHAMPEVLRALPQTQLDLVGEGTLRSKLEELSGALGVSQNVHFLGMRREVAELLGGSDVFVFSTTANEGLGTVLIEALAAGLPVVASDVPACRELLMAGERGTLVPAGEPAQLARSLIQALTIISQKNSRPAQAALALGEFTPARMMAAYLAAAQ